MNIQDIRSLFPALQTHTYLNTAGCGLMAAQTAARAKQFYDEFAAKAIMGRDEWTARAEQVRARVAGFLKVQPQELAFIPDVATIMNHVAHMFREPVQVLMASNEFPSMTLPWYAAGHDLQLVPAETNGSISIHKLADAITPRTKILCISHVHFDTGYRNDLDALGKLCREKNILFLLDTTQSLGAYPVDIPSQHIDMLVSNCYKWMTAGYGISLLYISSKLQDEWRIPALGSNSVTIPGTSMEHNLHHLRKGAALLETGQQPFENVFRLESAMELLETIGWDAIHSRVDTLVSHLYSKFRENDILIHFDHEKDHRSALVMAEGDWNTVKHLEQKKIIISPSKGKGIRISPHFYNTEEEIDVLCEELRRLRL